MLHTNTLYEIQHNSNTGVEYEIALFYVLLPQEEEKAQVLAAINLRTNAEEIKRIIHITDKTIIEQALAAQGLSYNDCSFETQNDLVGPADIVLYLTNGQQLGLSVKFANTCTLNVTGLRFITQQQKEQLQQQLKEYTRLYIEEMQQQYVAVENWFRLRKPSNTTDAFIDLIRDAVIANWNHIPDKVRLLQDLYHADSPINYWVAEYTRKGLTINTHPTKIDVAQADRVTLAKHETSFVAFYLDGERIGHMQVKFNNGFVERCKKAHPDFSVEGIAMAYGKPFSSWNFSIERK